MKEKLTTDERDRRVLELCEKLAEIEQRLIPTGMHVFGRPSGQRELIGLLTAVASFERPEIATPSLADLIASELGLPSYSDLVKEAAASEERLRQREAIESLLREAIEFFVSLKGDEAVKSSATMLADRAGVPVEESSKVFALLARIRNQLELSGELEGLMKALSGRYVEPGPGADIIQNPDVLPTGRNTHAVNPYSVPSYTAYHRAEPLASALLARHLKEQGRYPEAIAMVLWGIDNIKTGGEAVAQALWLLGVAPRRDSMNRVTDVEVMPLEKLARPRIDVVMTVSGIFRDLFGPTVLMLDGAVRRVAALDEPDELNYVRRNVRRQMAETGSDFDEALVRVFSNAAGNYGANVNFMVMDSQWENSRELGELFVTRKCFAYGRDSRGRPFDGQQARGLLEQALARVEVTYQNIDTTEVGITDVDHYFEYLGGVSKAVEVQRGAKPVIYLSDTLSPGAKIRTLEETVRLESRTKTLNPKWYEGMLRHGFSGVAEIERHVTNTFGWSATSDAVDGWIYDEVAATFVMDEAMLEKLRSLNPHSAQSLVGRLLEASGRGYWSPDETVLGRLHEISANIEDELEGVAR